jgi:hypothetical protein
MIQRHIAGVFAFNGKSLHIEFGFNHLCHSSAELEKATNTNNRSSIHAEESAVRNLLNRLGYSNSLKRRRFAEWCFLSSKKHGKRYPQKDKYPCHPI